MAAAIRRARGPSTLISIGLLRSSTIETSRLPALLIALSSRTRWPPVSGDAGEAIARTSIGDRGGRVSERFAIWSRELDPRTQDSRASPLVPALQVPTSRIGRDCTFRAIYRAIRPRPGVRSFGSRQPPQAPQPPPARGPPGDHVRSRRKEREAEEGVSVEVSVFAVCAVARLHRYGVLDRRRPQRWRRQWLARHQLRWRRLRHRP